MIKSPRLAILDMGTNTFHLIIVERSESQLGFKVIHRDRQYVLLAEGGIKTISDKATLRAKSAIDDFKIALSQYPDLDIEIVGTEALRIASNGSVIINYVYEQLGVEPHIISGQREAELIYKGNDLIARSGQVPFLIMDIGGGSTEFILANAKGILFSKSYPLGVTKVFNEFNEQDPISAAAIQRIESHIDHLLKDLTGFIEDYELNGLIGASGSFEVLSDVLHGSIPKDSIVNIEIADFNTLASKLITSTIDQRRQIEGIPESRVKLIQVAFVMMRRIIQKYKPKQIGVSPFAIKEGLVSEWL